MIVGVVAYGVLFDAAMVLDLFWPDLFGFQWAGGGGAGLDVAAGVVAGIAGAAVSWPAVMVSTSARRTAGWLGSVLAGMPPWGLVVLALAAGTAEEAFFRGAMWHATEEAGGDLVALAVTSIAFGAAHGAFGRRFLSWSVYATAMGGVLGAMRMWSGGILMPVVCHVALDAINMPLLARMDAGSGHVEPDEPIPPPAGGPRA